MASRRRNAWILGACLAVGAVVFGVYRWSSYGSANSASSRDVVEQTASADAADERAFALRIRLLPDAGVSASPGSVRIGLAHVSPDELAAYQAWLRGGGEGAGPRDFEDLATVTRWLNVPATLNAEGVVIATPVRLPAADRYVLQARADDGLRFYEASFTRDNVPVEIGPRVAAGLRLRAPAQAAGGARVLFRRVDGAQDAAWQALIRREAPEVLDAYDERALPVGADTIVAPLPPGPLDLIAVVDGVETGRRRVALSAGRITTFDLDAEVSELAAALSTTVALRLVVKGGATPVKDAAVVWSSPRGERSLRSDASGALRIEGVDPLQPLTIEIRFAPPKTPSFLVDALPIWPERLPMTLDLADAPVNAGVIAKTIELEPLRWLMVETPGIGIPRRPRVEEPFPVFVLQRREGAVWRDSSADYFRPVTDGLAVSLDRPGNVRVVAVLAPWTVRYSDAVEVGDGSPEIRYRTRVSGVGGRRVGLRIAADHRPLASAPVHLLSPLRGVPPKTLTADRAGQLVLDHVTEADVLVEVPGFEQVRVRLDAAEVTVNLRREDG
ncbi:MAG: hypothetical protein HOP03_13255 [Lysobacter sp.]|nr:hypothetical protein [Lysobacter sp.]